MLTADVLAAYRPKSETAAVYTIDDHAHLLESAMRAVFDALRQEVLALDPCVTEKFLKY